MPTCVCGTLYDSGDVLAEVTHEWCRFESSAPPGPTTDPAPAPDKVSTWPAPAEALYQLPPEPYGVLADRWSNPFPDFGAPNGGGSW